MTLRVSGKNMDIGEALRGQVEARVASAITKYFDGSYSGHVTVAREGTGFRTDCILHLASGITLEASGSGHDAHLCFDQTAGRIEKRLRRYKRRLKGRALLNGAGTGAVQESVAAYVLEPPGDEFEEQESFHPVVVAETTKPLHTLAVADAVVELDMTGAPAVVFRHAGSGRVNVVYRRHDGTIGWIDPPGDSPKEQA